MVATRAPGPETGVVYTPPEITRPMVELALAPLVVGASAAQILALRICDPAIGEGAFLVEIVRVLADALVRADAGPSATRRDAGHRDGAVVADRPERDDGPLGARERVARRLVAERCVFGVDVDARAVTAARAAVERCVGTPVAALRDHLRVADALATAWPAPPFDALVGNPPYVRQERLGATTKRALRTFEAYDGVADLYVYFVELALRIARRYCLIIPNKWLTAAYGRPLRELLARSGSLERIVDFGGALPLFASADAFPCIVVGTAGTAAPLRVTRVASSATRGPLARAAAATISLGPAARAAAADATIPRGPAARAAAADATIPRGPAARAAAADATIPRGPAARAAAADATTSRGPVARALAAPGLEQPRARWSAEPWHLDGRADGALVDRLARRWPALETIVEPPARGVVTGCNRAFVVDGATRARLVAQDPAADAWLRPFAKGRDVRRWRPAPADRYLVLVDRGGDPPAAIRAHLAPLRAALEPRPKDHAGSWPGRKPGAYRWFELQDPVGALARSRRPRLFYQDIQTAPACCLDPTGAFVPDTTVWILASDDRFLLALLNSRLYGWYARRRFPPALNGAVRPKLAYMRALPVAEPPRGLRSRITELVDAQLAAPAPARDAALDELVCDAYELSRRERSLLLEP